MAAPLAAKPIRPAAGKAALRPPHLPQRGVLANVDPGAVIGSLTDAVLVINGGGVITYVNHAAEQFFDASAVHLRGQGLSTLLPGDSPLFAILRQVRDSGASVTEDDVNIDSQRIGPHVVVLKASPMVDADESVVISIYERTIARKIDRQLVHRNAARSVTAMAAMLAHEVKNPLSGIRGAAQLLEQNADSSDRELTRLIIEETDRICALVDRMGIFTDGRPLDRGPVNIHQVIEHARKVAQTGFARRIRFTENYDPSLPPVHGNRDRLIQVFLNLIKNAAEACPPKGGEIVLSTAYQHGVRVAVPGSATRMQLPLVVSVQDNGEGIPDDLRAHLFDPFVTTKATGTGLGLALVAKIIGDHGGVIEFDSQPRRTVFRVLLPMYVAATSERSESEGAV